MLIARYVGLSGTHIHGTAVPVEEPSTASTVDMGPPRGRYRRARATTAGRKIRVQIHICERFAFDDRLSLHRGSYAKHLIPSPIDQNRWAHWRNPMDMIRQG